MSVQPTSARRRHGAVLRTTSLIGLLALSLVVGVVGPAADAAPAAPEQTREGPLWTPQKEKSIPGSTAKVLPRPADPVDASKLSSAPAVVWPRAGSAEVEVPGARVDGARWQAALTGTPPSVRAGGLPVWIGPARQPATVAAEVPAKVRVDLLGRRGDGVQVRLTRTDKAAGGTVALGLDYSGFRHAFGADWAARLRVVRASDGAALPTRHTGDGRLTADVAATGLYAVQASAAGGSGDFGASGLSPSATWSVGGQSGDFTWSYPMEAPPGLGGGPRAQVSLDYSSGSVDGRTTGTNNQTSWAGEGFEVMPGGSIERRYKACSLDMKDSNTTTKTGDLCWGTDNATFTLNGKGGELVRDDATGAWHPRGDDGSKVERLTGAPNGENNGEYWRITTKDGTRFYFGLNRLPGWTAGKDEAKSTWTVPVFGNQSGEPCHTSSFATSHCQQAYRWNLDYVVDRHGNTMSLFYDTESNNYARNLTAASVSSYTRSGSIKRIEYGQRDGQVFTTPAVARVLFTPAERCVPGSACSTSQPSTYPDTPLDLACSSTTSCTNKYNPSFWTSKRLAKVTTQVWRGTAFADVSSWTLRHEFADPGDGTSPRLWLEAVSNAGHVGGGLTQPEVNFDGVQKTNRVDPASPLMPMNWWRVNRISYGTGGDLGIVYSGPDCTATSLPAPDTNGRRCHPLRWTPPGQTTERTDWFHKYVVTSVTETDRVAQSDPTRPEPVVTSVEYLTPPAWHHDEEDGLVDIARKTWSQWRGYEKVRTRKGRAGGTQTVTDHLYFRGMDGDLRADGSTKDVPITDSTGVVTKDAAPLAGQELERITYDGSTVIDRASADHWISPPTATRVKPWGTTKAYQVEQGAVRQGEAVEGGWRSSSAKNTYSPTGELLAASDLNDLADPADDTCTRYEYGALAELPTRAQVVSVACDKAWTNQQVVSDQRTTYNDAGDPVRAERLSGFDSSGNPTYQTVQTTGFDAVGRMTSVADALGRTTTTSYTPASGPVTKTTVTQPGGHTTSTELEPAWGEETAIIDAAGRRTDSTRDPLGRASKVWLPGRDRSAAPNVEYGYQQGNQQPSVVTTKTLQADGSFETTYEISDGLLRKRQTQQPAPGGGRAVTDHLYDSRGLLVKENGPYYNDAPPASSVLNPVEPELPTQKLTTYDGAERPTGESFVSEGALKWSTVHSHSGDRQTVDPPAGEQPTTRITDVQGKVRELRQYTGGAPTGGYDKTAYTYTPAGQLAKVTDPAGNAWTFGYDLRGRKVTETDPDKGTTTYTYNDLDQLTSSTDARGITLAFGYDALGRRTAVHEGSLSGPKRAEWTYDTLVKGSLTSATRWVNGHAYTVRSTGYDAGGRPTGTEVVIPAAEGALAGTYPVANTYTPDGKLAIAELPAVGGLPAETLRYGYNAQGLPTTLSGATSYLTGTTYTAYGEVESMLMRTTGGKWVKQSNQYETGTRRLSHVITERETLPRRISDIAYNYDPGGNVTKITDTSGTGEATDTQCFGYDHLRRMTAAWTPASSDCAAAPAASGLGGPAPYWHQWTFDLTGNRKSETRTTAAGATTSTYEYPAAGQARPHAVQKVTSGSAVNSYGYDAAGNLTQRTLAGVGETLTWDPEGHLEKVTRGASETSYLYDAEGDRLIRRDSTGVTLYLGQTELKLSSGAVTGTRYYGHGDKTVAVRTGGKVTWLGSDHHGTAHVSIDADTQAFQRRRTTPYGEGRGPAPSGWPGERGFVNGTQDKSTDLVHLGAREYDPTTGRFISVDPVADFSDPQQLNAYAYANNNPATFVDADGEHYVTTTVTQLVREARWITKRIVEKHRERHQAFKYVVKYTASMVWSFLTGNIVKMLSYFVRVTYHYWVWKTIVRTIKKLEYRLKKIQKTVTRWVGDKHPAAREINGMVRKVSQLAAQARQEHSNMLRSVMARVSQLARAPASKGGIVLASFSKGEGDSDKGDTLMGILFTGMAAIAAGLALWLAEAATLVTIIVSGVAAILAGVVWLFKEAIIEPVADVLDWIWDGLVDFFTESPAEKAAHQRYLERMKKAQNLCLNWPGGCQPGQVERMANGK